MEMNVGLDSCSISVSVWKSDWSGERVTVYDDAGREMAGTRKEGGEAGLLTRFRDYQDP